MLAGSAYNIFMGNLEKTTKNTHVRPFPAATFDKPVRLRAADVTSMSIVRESRLPRKVLRRTGTWGQTTAYVMKIFI